MHHVIPIVNKPVVFQVIKIFYKLFIMEQNLRDSCLETKNIKKIEFFPYNWQGRGNNSILWT